MRRSRGPIRGDRSGRADSRFVAEAGMVLALSGLLKAVSVAPMPHGGSITLGAMAPLWAFALRHGPLAGAGIGAAFGLLDLMLRPHVYHWAQVLLDYPVAFAFAGLAGVRIWPVAIGMALASLGRYAAHVLSGIVFFSAMAPPGMPALEYSALYNLYVFPDAALAAFALLGMRGRLPEYLERIEQKTNRPG